MPTPTVIMLAEWFLLAKIFKTVNIENAQTNGFQTIFPPIRWPSLLALISGLNDAFNDGNSSMTMQPAK